MDGIEQNFQGLLLRNVFGYVEHLGEAGVCGGIVGGRGVFSVCIFHNQKMHVYVLT